MYAPKSRQARSSLNGRSVHAGLVGHGLWELPMHIIVRIQILVTEHLVIRREYFYHSHRRQLSPKRGSGRQDEARGDNRLGRTIPDGETVTENKLAATSGLACGAQPALIISRYGAKS